MVEIIVDCRPNSGADSVKSEGVKVIKDRVSVDKTDAVVTNVDTDEHVAQMAGGSSNILVAVRVRRLLPKERNDGGRDIARVLSDKVVCILDPGGNPQDDYLRSHKSREKQFAFDKVFGIDVKSDEVYRNTTKFLIDGVCQGFNATVFAYGATGAGKTHTMLGSFDNPGLMLNTLTDLFERIRHGKEEESLDFQVKCSFLEVYNENIRDLLSPSQDYLELREDPMKGMMVVGISEVTGLKNATEIMSLLQRGNQNRTTEPTAANRTSSRSHAILQVSIEERNKTAGVSGELNIGKLSMVDLAGSERAAMSHNRGLRLIEGANINRSLLALGNCITALADKSSGKNTFVPYRDSKLTRFLKDSLGGNCRTVMIANISPCHLNFEDTLNTLKYANRAKNIKTKVTRNVLQVNYHIAKYTAIIAELRDEVTVLKSRLASKQSIRSPQITHAVDDSNIGSSQSSFRESELWKNELMQSSEERTNINKNRIDVVNELTSLSLEQNNLKQLLVNFEEKNILGEIPTHPVDGRAMSRFDIERELNRISDNIENSLRFQAELDSQLAENEKRVNKLQEDLPQRIENSDLRAFLYLLFKTQMLEIENMEINELFKTAQNVNTSKEKEIHSLEKSLVFKDSLIKAVIDHIGEEAYASCTSHLLSSKNSPGNPVNSSVSKQSVSNVVNDSPTECSHQQINPSSSNNAGGYQLNSLLISGMNIAPVKSRVSADEFTSVLVSNISAPASNANVEKPGQSMGKKDRVEKRTSTRRRYPVCRKPSIQPVAPNVTSNEPQDGMTANLPSLLNELTVSAVAFSAK